MKNFKNLVDERLSAATVDPNALMRTVRARTAEKPRALRLRRPALAALSMVLVLGMATALAVGLIFSHQYSVTRAAKQAVMEKYGISQRTIELFNTTQIRNENGDTVTFLFETMGPELAQATGRYTVTVTNGKVTDTAWSLEGAEGAWGEKELEQYIAQREQEHRDLMAYSESMRDQWRVEAQKQPEPESVDGVRLLQGQNSTPEGTGLDQYQVIELANAAIQEQFGVSQRGLALFSACADYDAEIGKWFVSYEDNGDWAYYAWQELYRGSMGKYRAIVVDADGTVADAHWTIRNDDSTAYTAETWGKAQVYSGEMLDFVADMLEKRKALLEPYAPNPYASAPCTPVEVNAALDKLMLDAGFPMQPYYNHVLPEAGDLTLDEAKELFYQALHSEYDVTREVFDSSVYAYADLTQEETHRQWYFWLQSSEELCSWSVQINAQTGEIIDLRMDLLASANG